MIYVLLPAYNEESGLQQVLPALVVLAPTLDAPLKVVVVDDGSRDRTSEIAQSFADRLDLKLFRFERNKGVGAVFTTGLRFVAGDSRDPDNDVCVVCDSDNTQDPALIPRMVAAIRSGDDIVIASRFAPGGRMVGCAPSRVLMSRGVGLLMRLLVGLRGVRDYSTFYRAYRLRVIRQGFEAFGDGLLEGRGFAAVGGLLIKVSNYAGRISEVPLVLRYDRKGGTSGIKLLRTARGYLELIVLSLLTRRFARRARAPAGVATP